MTDSHNSAKNIQASITIAESYDFSGAAIELGTVVIDGQSYPDAKVRIPLAMMNRHGLVAGATGTGKTKTLQLITEQLSSAGIPVLLADVKGDLSGLSKPGEINSRTEERAKETGDNWQFASYPTEFVSIGTGGVGVPLRATVESFGPILLAKVLGLNETQESTLSLIFRWAADKNLELIDLKDIRAVINHLISDEGKTDLNSIGGVSKQTAGVILRVITVLESNGGNAFFGEPEVDVNDLLRIIDGKGVVTLCELSDQASNPVLFSTFLMWVLSTLYKKLPEVGDIDKPKLVFIFDEAHTLFHGSSKAFRANIERTVKLIRSKGVGIFFCSQLPTDIPNEVLSQLGARIQHALRAFTPDDQQALARTVKTYPITQYYNLDHTLTSLGIGEAIITVLSEKGAPTAVAWTKIRSPRSLMADIGRDNVITAAHNSSLWAKYSQTINRDSAYEKLQAPQNTINTTPLEPSYNQKPQEVDFDDNYTPRSHRSESATRRSKEDNGILSSIVESSAIKSFLRSAGNSIGKEITRSIFGAGRKKR